MNKNFFDDQSSVTEAKIKIYEKYIEGYLPKLLMQFKKCILIDLFSGNGKNGENDGSPIILLKTINKLLESTRVNNKVENIYVLFNDFDSSNIEQLEFELDKISYNKSKITIQTKNESYETYLKVLIEKQNNPKFKNIPRFIFLDPFTYSIVKMDELKKLMSLPTTEVLLFMPIFHTYRFSSKEYHSDHKTRKFVEEFTIEGVKNYENVIEFMFSVANKIKNEINLEFVRPILLDAGARKNSLFLLTKHREGMLLMNNIVIKTAKEGFRWFLKDNSSQLLFESNEFSIFYENFKKTLINTLQSKNLTNKEIVDITIRECFIPKNAKSIIDELFKNKKIKVFDNNGNAINNKLKWNIAEEVNSIVNFEWIK